MEANEINARRLGLLFLQKRSGIRTGYVNEEFYITVDIDMKGEEFELNICSHSRTL